MNVFIYPLAALGAIILALYAVCVRVRLKGFAKYYRQGYRGEKLKVVVNAYVRGQQAAFMGEARGKTTEEIEQMMGAILDDEIRQSRERAAKRART